MELNLSHLLEKKEIDIRLGDNVFTGVISAAVIDLVQNQSAKKIQKLLKSKKMNMSTLSKAYKNKDMRSLDNDQIFELFEKMDIDVSDLFESDDALYNEVVQGFFGSETYALYTKTLEEREMHLINKQIYEIIVAQIQADTTAQDTSEKNE